MAKSNKIGLSAKSPSDYFINNDLIDYTIKTKKIERKSQKIECYEKVDLIISIPDVEHILLTKIKDDDIPIIRLENDDKEAVEALLQCLYRKGYRRYK
jgi:hypothetical protein